MPLLEFPKRLLAVAETLAQWGGAIAALDRRQRARVARYADAIAATLSRAAAFSVRLTEAPEDAAARRGLKRELGRIAGYLETLVGVLKHHLDGRKLAGVKRRLEQLDVRRAGFDDHRAGEARATFRAKIRVDRLLQAEGYFRALADSLRT